jgi:hypothetical protein
MTTSDHPSRPGTPSVLSGLLSEHRTSEVVLSGRCGECGYLLESQGHRISCGPREDEA